MNRGLRRWLWLLPMAVGCAGSPKPNPEPVVVQEPLHQGPLTDFVPAAGLRWLMVIRLDELRAEPSIGRWLNRLLPEKRRRSFLHDSGVDPQRVSTLCSAGFDDGQLLLVDAAEMADSARSAFEQRLVSDPLAKQEGPGVVRVTGLVGTTLESFVSVKGRFFGVAVGNPALSRVVAAFARNRLRRSPAALQGAALSSLPQSLANDPLRYYAAGPFLGEYSLGVFGLLRNAVAAAVTARPEGTGRVRLTAVLAGDFGPELDSSRERLLATWSALRESPLGRLTGLDRPEVRSDAAATMDTVTLSVSAPLEPLLSGLDAAVLAELRELLHRR